MRIGFVVLALTIEVSGTALASPGHPTARTPLSAEAFVAKHYPSVRQLGPLRMAAERELAALQPSQVAQQLRTLLDHVAEPPRGIADPRVIVALHEFVIGKVQPRVSPGSDQGRELAKLAAEVTRLPGRDDGTPIEKVIANLATELRGKL